MAWSKSGTTTLSNTPTFEDGFGSDAGWVTSNATYMDYCSSNSRLKTHWKGGIGNATVVYDLGAGNVSDEKWVFRMKINFGSTNGADNEGFIGISDSDETAGKCTSQDFLGVSFLAGYSTTAWNGIYQAEANGATLPPTQSNLLVYNIADCTNYWLEITRTSTTGLKYELFSDEFVTSLGSQTVTISSGTGGLRYLKFTNYPAASTDQPGAFVDDVKFWNDTTSATGRSDTITISCMAPNKFNQIIGHVVSNSTDINRLTRFNGDTGNNYANRYSSNGGADATSTSGCTMFTNSTGAQYNEFGVAYFVDFPGNEKLLISKAVGDSASTGAGTAPDRRETVGKYANTAQINKVDAYNSDVGDYDPDSNIAVTGTD